MGRNIYVRRNSPRHFCLPCQIQTTKGTLPWWLENEIRLEISFSIEVVLSHLIKVMDKIKKLSKWPDMRAASMPRHAQQHIFVLDHPKQHLRKNKKNCQIKVWSHKSNPYNEAHNQTMILDHISISFKIIWLNLVKSISDHVLYLVPPIWPQSAKLSLSLLLQLGIRSAANVDLELAAREKPCLFFPHQDHGDTDHDCDNSGDRVLWTSFHHP